MSGETNTSDRIEHIAPREAPGYWDREFAKVPQPLRALLLKAIAWAEGEKDASLAVHGSIVMGGVDKFSDLDLSIASTSASALSAVTDSFGRFVSLQGDVLAHFKADHLRAEHTQIIYLDIDNWVVKFDVTIFAGGSEISLPPEALVIIDKGGVLTQAQRHSRPIPEVSILFEKLCGWLWFTFSRLERGEVFAAARSIDFSREEALLPIILARLGLPQDGHRRLEQRLPKLLLDMLLGTHPESLEPGAIFLALAQLYKVTLLELEQSCVEQRQELHNSMSQMWERICTVRESFKNT